MESLIGYFFHSFDEQGKMVWQGRVISQTSDGNYVVQLYNWITGDESIRKIVSEKELTRWTFYETDVAWNLAAERLMVSME